VLNDDLMRRFLIVLAQGERNREIVLHVDSLEGVNPAMRLEFKRNGPLMIMTAYVVKDRWGREVDRCGQVKCGKCDVRVNYDYPDGSKREFCSEHES
jgi:hypothetical protein